MKKKIHVIAVVIAIFLILMMIWIYDNIYLIETVKQEASLAASQGNLEKIKSSVSKKPQIVNRYDRNGRTILHTAVINGHLNVVDYLITSGTDVNMKDKDGNTPLKLAKNNNRKDIVELLTKKGAKE